MTSRASEQVMQWPPPRLLPSSKPREGRSQRCGAAENAQPSPLRLSLRFREDVASELALAGLDIALGQPGVRLDGLRGGGLGAHGLGAHGDNERAGCVGRWAW